MPHKEYQPARISLSMERGIHHKSRKERSKSFTILRAKDRNAEHRLERVPLHAQAVPWARRLCKLAPPAGPVTTLPATWLNSWLRARLAGTRGADCTWHAFRRGMATTMWKQGAPLQRIMQQGSWSSASVCRQYIFSWVD